MGTVGAIMRTTQLPELSAGHAQVVRRMPTTRPARLNRVRRKTSLVSAPSFLMSGERVLSALEQAGAVAFRYWTVPSLRFDYLSPAFEALTGLGVDDVQDSPLRLFERIHPDDRATLERVLSDTSTDPVPVTVRWRHQDGREVWTEGHRFALRDEGGRVVGFVGFGFDVTNRPHAGEQDYPQLNAIALRALSERLEQVLEGERTRIARELHDELGQLLTGAKLDFSSTIRRLQELRTPGDVVDKLQAAMGQVELGIAMVRRIATELRPPGLDHRDLGAAMEYEARRVSTKSGVAITIANRVDISVDPAIATVAFRVFQEALTNVVRHAQARSVRASAAVKIGRAHV